MFWPRKLTKTGVWNWGWQVPSGCLSLGITEMLSLFRVSQNNPRNPQGMNQIPEPESADFMC